MMKWLLTGLVALLTVLSIATTWKMIAFRDRLHDLISNSRWEQRLADQGAYDPRAPFTDSSATRWISSPP